MKENITRLMRIYSTVKVLGGRGNSKRIAEIVGVSERTVQRYLKVLVDGGYIEPKRHGMKLYYRVVNPLTEREAKELLSGEKQEEAPVYRLAKEIDNIIEEGKYRADLIGSAKIHMILPFHSRITHDIDVIVAREHATQLTTTLKYVLNLELERKGGVHADYRFRHIVNDIKVDVIVDGFKENGVIVWNLAPVLRKGRITLEHVILGKLIRRSFREEADTYDVAVSLPHINISRFLSIYQTLRRENPAIADRVRRHLEKTREYVREEYQGFDGDIILAIISKIMKNLNTSEEKKRHVNRS